MSSAAKKNAVLRGLSVMRDWLAVPSELNILGEQAIGIFYDVYQGSDDPAIRTEALAVAKGLFRRLGRYRMAWAPWMDTSVHPITINNSNLSSDLFRVCLPHCDPIPDPIPDPILDPDPDPVPDPDPDPEPDPEGITWTPLHGHLLAKGPYPFMTRFRFAN